jgi:putative resolvase
LKRLIEVAKRKEVDAIVVAHKDRLTRFSFEYLEHFFKQYGVKMEAVFGEEPKDAYQELVEDLIEVVTSFAGKLYGLRGHKKKSSSRTSENC